MTYCPIPKLRIIHSLTTYARSEGECRNNQVTNLVYDVITQDSSINDSHTHTCLHIYLSILSEQNRRGYEKNKESTIILLSHNFNNFTFDNTFTPLFRLVYAISADFYYSSRHHVTTIYPFLRAPQRVLCPKYRVNHNGIFPSHSHSVLNIKFPTLFSCLESQSRPIMSYHLLFICVF